LHLWEGEAKNRAEKEDRVNSRDFFSLKSNSLGFCSLKSSSIYTMTLIVKKAIKTGEILQAFNG